MLLNHIVTAVLIHFICCKNEVNAETPESSADRTAVRECQEIMKRYQPSLGNYIVGGERALLGEFPHMVALGYDLGKGLRFNCGGAVVSPNYVLTAAHCVLSGITPYNPNMVRGGDINIGGTEFNPETDTKIEEIIYHPKYYPRRKYNDLALLKLASPLKFTANLNAICLETDDEDPKVPLTITGWGKIGYHENEGSDVLLKAEINVVPRDNCTILYKNTPTLPSGITEDQLCAGDPEGKHDACQGDSGGPLIIPGKDGHNRLVGVTSFGRLCGTLIPGVYIRVSRYLDWLESVVWPN